MIGLRKDEPCGEGQCPSVHIWSDQRCIRRAGHSGRCRGRACARRDIGTLTTAEWISDNGVFYMHAGYYTTYPTNMARSAP